jgi:hypothetical protein
MILTTDIDDAAAIVADKAFVDLAAREDDILLMLRASASTGKGVTNYRPWYVAGKTIEQTYEYQVLSEADGAKFTNLITTVLSLFNFQQSIDLSLAGEPNNLVVPAGFSAGAAIANVNNCKCGGGASASSSANIYPVMAIKMG